MPRAVISFFSIDEGKRTYIAVEAGKREVIVFPAPSRGQHGFKFGTVYLFPDGTFESRQELCAAFNVI